MMARIAAPVYLKKRMVGVFTIYLLVIEDVNERVEYEALKVEREFP